MESLFEWLRLNSEWVFSGIGVAIIFGILKWLKSKNGNPTTQSQKSGKNSLNIQAGQDVNIGNKTGGANDES